MNEQRVALRHRPLIDGFRGLMILVTVGYHLGGWTSPAGGWVGVSGFFVLSGYLITSLLLREHGRDGSISFRRFYARRFRRLAPALLTVLAGTVAVAAALGGAREFPTLRGDSLATLLYVANWRFIASAQSYFASFNPSPLRHAWSLAIEEQFYVVWPLLLVGLLRVLRRRHLAIVLAVGAVASAAWMAVLASGGGDVSRAYYGTDTRAQELLVGALLATVVSASRDDDRVRRGAEWIGLAGLVGFVGVWLFMPADERWPYLGGGFLATAVVSAMLVYGCARTDGGPLRHVLGNAPMRALGDRSYVLYLVHWPAIIFMAPSRLDWNLALLDTARIVVALAITEVVHRFVERPVHRGTLSLPRPGWMLLGGATASALLTVALTVPPAGREIAPREGGEQVVAANPEAEPGETLPPPEPGDRLVLLGDSQAWILLQNVPAGFELQVSGFHHARCDIIGEVIFTGSELNDEDQNCPTWPEQWDAALVGGTDAVVVTLGLRQLYDLAEDGERIEIGTGRWEQRYRAAVRRALGVIRARTDAPIVWQDVPCYRWDEVSSDGEASDPVRLDEVNAVLADELARDPATTVVAYRDRVCRGPDHAEVDPTIRPDGAHLTIDAAHETWWWLHDEVRAAQAAAPR